MADFDDWFQRLTGNVETPPHDWQRALAAEVESRSRLIRIPTGMGKTLGFSPLGASPETTRGVASIRTEHRRFPALRAELDRALGSS